jgi:hypothetical protein
MQMLMKVQFPVHKFNEAVRQGTVGQIMGRILEKTKPKAAYFTAENGCRGGTMVIDVEKPSDIPFYAEPWFLYFDAKVELLPFMTPEDLQNARLEDMNEIWPEG